MGAVCIFPAWYFAGLPRAMDLRHCWVPPLLCPPHSSLPPIAPRKILLKAKVSPAIACPQGSHLPSCLSPRTQLLGDFLDSPRESPGSRSLSWDAGCPLGEGAPLLSLHLVILWWASVDYIPHAVQDLLLLVSSWVSTGVPVKGSWAQVGEFGLFPFLRDPRGAQEGLQLSRLLGSECN